MNFIICLVFPRNALTLLSRGASPLGPQTRPNKSKHALRALHVKEPSPARYAGRAINLIL